ncbi:MAG TPA: polysaccharide deacetylase family protein [Kofleriaceae bacterium]|nr:polysaccharide deacetylase family protein [Kofleriaceae bacterium]
MSTRERLATMLHRAGALGALMLLRKLAPVPSTVSILTYHHVAGHDTAYPYDPGVADASPAQFRRQMEMLARYGTPIGVDELVRAVEGAALPKNAVMVTFDDGYRSCHDVVLPILRAVGMRATFFVPTGFVNDRKLYWWERVAVVLGQARVEKATLTYPYRFEISARDPRSHRTLTDVIKNTPNLDTDRFVDDLCTAFGVEWNAAIEAQHADNLIMSWDHIRALSRAGMDVESHTRWHRVLQTLDDQALEDELAGSRRDLETQIGRPVRVVAYPVGRRVAHVKRIRDAVVAAGYKVGVTNSSGATRIWPEPLSEMIPTDRFDISRLSTDRDMSDAMYFTQIAVPSLAYIGRHDL